MAGLASRAELIAKMGKEAAQAVIDAAGGTKAYQAAVLKSKEQEILDRAIAEIQPMFAPYEGAQPTVPQQAFPRVNVGPRMGVSPELQAATQDPAIRERMLAGMQRGMPMRDWYNMEPTRLLWGDVVGSQDLGNQYFDRFTNYMGTTSPVSDVDLNYRNATRWTGYDINKTLPEESLTTIPGKGGKPQEKLIPPPPPGYGSTGQINQYKLSMPILTGQIPAIDPLEHLKTSRYSGALGGNLANVPVDRHAQRAPLILQGDPRGLSTSVKLGGGVPTFNAQERFAQEGMDIADVPVTWWKDVPKNPAEYYMMEDYFKGLAQELGLPPASGQATAWVGHGPITGLGTEADKTAQQLLITRVAKTAIERGMDPRDVLTRMMRGQQPLAVAGTGLGLGSQLLPGGGVREEQ